MLKINDNIPIPRKPAAEIKSGPFWTIQILRVNNIESVKVSIDVGELDAFLKAQGFYKVEPGSKYEVWHIIENVYDEHNSINSINEWLEKEIINKIEPEYAKHIMCKMRGKVNEATLRMFNVANPILPLSDDRDTSWFVFADRCVRVSSEAIELLPFSDYPTQISSSFIKTLHKIELDYSEGEFERFCKNVSGSDEKFATLRSIVGYMLHQYNNPAFPVAVFITDEDQTYDGDPNGGKGKGIFAKSFGYFRKLSFIPGKQLNYENQFEFGDRMDYQTRILSIEDIRRNFPFDMLYNILTDGVSLDQKFKEKLIISQDRAPKIIITSNFPLPEDSSSTARRKFEFEFTSYYHSTKGKSFTPVDEFGHTLFGGWDGTEWNRFFTFYLRCMQFYLSLPKREIIPYNSSTIELNRAIGKVGHSCFQYFEEMVREQNSYGNNQLVIDHIKHFDEYNKFNPGGKFKISMDQFLKKLYIWADFRKYAYVRHYGETTMKLLADQPQINQLF